MGYCRRPVKGWRTPRRKPPFRSSGSVIGSRLERSDFRTWNLSSAAPRWYMIAFRVRSDEVLRKSTPYVRFFTQKPSTSSNSISQNSRALRDLSALEFCEIELDEVE